MYDDYPNYPIKNLIDLLFHSYCTRMMFHDDIEDNVHIRFHVMLIDGLVPSNHSIAQDCFVLDCYYKSILSAVVHCCHLIFWCFLKSQ